jgi:hypothetical protein
MGVVSGDKRKCSYFSLISLGGLKVVVLAIGPKVRGFKAGRGN